MGISAQFGHSFEQSDDTIWVFPFKEDVDRLMYSLHPDIALVGKVYTLEHFIKQFFSYYFPEGKILDYRDYLSTFSIIKRIAMENNFLKKIDIVEYNPQIIDYLLQLFYMCEFSGIFKNSHLDNIKFNLDGNLRSSIELYFRYRKELSDNNYFTYEYLFYTVSNLLTDNSPPPFLNNIKNIIFSNFLEFSTPQLNFLNSISQHFDVLLSFPLEYHNYPSLWNKPITNILNHFNLNVYSSSINDKIFNSFPEILSTSSRSNISFSSNNFLQSNYLLFPDNQRVCEFIAKMSKILISEYSITPDDILIVSPNPEKYSSLLKFELNHLNIPNNISNSYTPFDLISIFSGLLFIYRTNFRRDSIINFFRIPLVKIYFSDIDSFEKWTLEKKILYFYNLKKYSNKRYYDYISAIDYIISFRENGKLNRDTVDNLFKHLHFDLLENTLSQEYVILFRKQYDLIYEIIENISSSQSDIFSKIKDLIYIYNKYKTNLNAPITTNGIRLLHLFESRNNRGKITFFIGFSEDNFPQKHIKNPLLECDYSDFLPNISDKYNVSVLSLIQAMISSKIFFFLFSKYDEEKVIKRSLPIDEILRYSYDNIDSDIDNILSENTAILSREIEKYFHLFKNAENVQIHKSIKKSYSYPYNIEISVTNIENMIDCPYKYLLILNIDEPEPPELEITLERKILGTIIHKILFELFRNNYVRYFAKEPAKQYELSKKHIKEYFNNLSNNDYQRIIKKFFSPNENIENLYSLFRRELKKIWNSDIPYTMLDKFEYDEIFAKNFIKNSIAIKTNKKNHRISELVRRLPELPFRGCSLPFSSNLLPARSSPAFLSRCNVICPPTIFK